MSTLESEATESAEFDAVNDEIGRWSSLSEGECQHFVSVEDGVLVFSRAGQLSEVNLDQDALFNNSTAQSDAQETKGDEGM